MENKKLDKGRINQRLVDREFQEIQESFSYTKSAISDLRKYFKIDTLEDVRKYGILASLEKYLAESETQFLGKLFVPQSEKKRIHAQYNEILTDLTSACNVIENVLKMPYKIEFNGEILVSDDEEIKKALEKKYYFEISDEDCKYFNILSKVFSALDEADEWEKTHNYVNFVRRGDILHPAECNIYSMWQRHEFSTDSFLNMIGGILGHQNNHDLDNN
jgi:hypothetical protein